MGANETQMTPQLKALENTDLSPMIRMTGVMLPRILDGYLKSLNEKQRNAFDRVLPVGGEKSIYVHLKGTPTPPIVIAMAQPPMMRTVSEGEVRQQKLAGVRLTIDDLQCASQGLSFGNLLKLGWRLKSQFFALLGIVWMFLPFLLLGPAELQDLKQKTATRFKPLFAMLPAGKR